MTTNRVSLGSLTVDKADNSEVKAKLKDATKRKKAQEETIEEAWERIFSMNNSAADERKLRQVKEAMVEGRIGREPVEDGKKQRAFSRAEALRIWRVLEDRKIEDRLREMVENTPDNYVLITEESELKRVVSELLAEDVIVFDVESTGTNVWTDKIVGHVLSVTSTDMHYYIPTGHRDERPQLPEELVLETLRRVYEDESMLKIAHNAKFDMQMLHNAGINVRGRLWDTLEAMKLLNENEPSYMLKPLVSFYLKDESYGYAELFGDDTGFDEVDLDTALAYAAKDGDITYRFYEFQRKHLARHGNILEYFEQVEMPLLPIVSKIELRGYDIDEDYARKIAGELRVQANKAHARVVAEFGDINLNSPPQLKAAIEGHIGRTIANTDAKQTLKPLANDVPIIADLLEYREVSKLLSTYYDALPELINPKTGRIHTRLHQNGAKTGRFSSGGGGSFNIQNQSGEARKMFVAPEGQYIVNADFSAQEVRIIASLSQEDILLDAFARGRDAYATLASEFFGKPYEECYKLPNGDDTPERAQMKVVLLSSMYGATKFGLSGSLGISVDEAEEFRLSFFDKYRKINAFIKESQTFAKRNGFVWIGEELRKRRLPDARRKETRIPRGMYNDPKYEEVRKLNGSIRRSMRQGPNAKVQGLAAIQTKMTMVELDTFLERKGWEWFAPIHDELAFYVTEDFSVEDYEEINRIMTQTFLLDGVENETDIEIQRRWSDSITIDAFLNGEPVPEL